MSEGGPQQAQLAASTRVAGGVALAGGLVLAMLAAMVVLLVLMLASINEMEADIDRTNQRIERTNDRIVNTNQLLRPFADIAPRYFRQSLPLLRQTTSEVEQTTERFLPDMEAAVVALAEETLPVMRDLQAVRVREGFARFLEASGVVLELVRSRPVGPVFSNAQQLLARIDRRDLIADADQAAEALPDIRREMERLRRRFGVSIQVQCLLLEHIRSIDRKTGGEVPPEGDPDRVPEECRGTDERGRNDRR